MSWTLAPSLRKLRDEINAKWPNRSKKLDGTIGDANHQARRSEHNPDSRGIVRAIDITADGIDVNQLLAATIGDQRVHYVIHNETIWSRTHQWRPRKYTGYNAHKAHIHISLRNTTSESASPTVVAAAANDTSAWFAGSAAPKPTPPVLKIGTKGEAVKRLQAGLNKVFPAYRHVIAPRGQRLAVDGIYGKHTAAWVTEFQKRVGILADGIVGPVTKRQLANYRIRIEG